MKRRDFLKLLGAGACMAAFPSGMSRVYSNGAVKPNIVLIFIDDMGWSDVVCNHDNGYLETPNIDQLASQGMRFTNGYAACAVCSPTRAAILTGQYPARIGITDWIGAVNKTDKELLCPSNLNYLPHEEVTIAEVLKSAGYATAHIGKWHLGSAAAYSPLTQGFDVYIDRSDYPSFDVTGDPKNIYAFTNEAMDFIEQHKTESFFLYLTHHAVHAPMEAKPELIQYYQNKTIPPGLEVTPEYAAMNHSVDESVGMVMDKLSTSGILENTVVIFTSDNGGFVRYTDNSPLRSGKGYAYEGGLRVPWIVRWPGAVQAGSVCDEPVCSVDVMPTVCEIVGVREPTGREVDGESIVPLLKQEGLLNRESLFWHFPHYRYSEEVPYSVIRSGNYKLIKHYEESLGYKQYVLFNLNNDPSEQTDLSDTHPEKVKELNEKLSAWLRHTSAKMPIKNPDWTGTPAEKKEVRIG